MTAVRAARSYSALEIRSILAADKDVNGLTLGQRTVALATRASKIAIVTTGGALLASAALACADIVYAGNAQSSRGVHDLPIAPAAGASRQTLYPGARADLRVTLTNPNAYPVTVTAIVSAGAVRSDKGPACTTTGVAFADRRGLSLTIGANAARTLTLVRAVSMSNASDDGCRGARFAIPLAVRATA